MKIFSYVVEHDNGKAPNPYFGFCTLCRCKFREDSTKPRNIVELAEKGNWVIGTGGSSKRSAGHGKLVYAMQVDEKITRGEYFDSPRFAVKKPKPAGTYAQSRGDNERPKNRFEREEQFVLISEHFYYFGRNAIFIPERLKQFEKRGPGFRRRFDPADTQSFVDWLEVEMVHRTGKLGEPSYNTPQDRPDNSPSWEKQCKSCS